VPNVNLNVEANKHTHSSSTLKVLAAKLAKHLAEVRATADDDDDRDEGKGGSGDDQAKRPEQFPVFHNIL
jgi:hypothetical protein